MITTPKLRRHLLRCSTALVAGLTCASAALAGPAPLITRGPYLQMPGPNTMTVVWHTDVVTAPASVIFGETVGLGSIQNAISTADLLGGFRHSATLSLAAPNTTYFYQVADAATTLTTPGVDYSFNTSPLPGTRQPIRIWTFGDSGYWPGHFGTEYMDTRQAYYDHVADGTANGAADATDVMMYLGDNAYTLGNDATYQSVFFSPPELQAFHQRQPFLSAVGNHEGFVSNTLAETGDYFTMFEFPTANELGTNGVASGSEAYYSFDYGNIHFVVLDSEENIEDFAGAGAAMLTWLENDLLATTSDWIIAAWHRPPYSRGFVHDSDVEQNEIDMREQVVPIIEDYGVDLVISGHAHTYERTPLIDNHIGLANTLSASSLLDAGDGDPAGDGPYHKASLGQGPHEGTVYIVNGAAADVRSFDEFPGLGMSAGPHPVMNKSLISLGTSIIEVDGDVLTGSFLDDTGAVLDTFQISKGFPNGCPATPHSSCATVGKMSVALKNKDDNEKDKAKVKLKTNMADSGWDLSAGASVSACVYADGVLAFSQSAPNGGLATYTTADLDTSLWEFDSSKPGKYSFKDKGQTFLGLKSVKIKTGEKGSYATSAGGAATAFPAFPLQTPIVVQFFNSDAEECWDIPVDESKIKNDAEKGLGVKGG